MQSYEVGKLFEEGKTQYQEGIKFDFNQGGGTLYILYDRPKQKEVEEIRKGRLQMGILYKQDIIFLLFKFGNLNWMDAPYSYQLSEPHELSTPEDDTGYSMTVLLIDAATGILKVVRQIGWPTKMSRQFHDYVAQQRNRDFSNHLYNAKLNEIYKNYTTNYLVGVADIYKVRED